MKVAAAQLSPVFLNKTKTVEKACSAILKAGENGAKLIFPVSFLSGYPDWVWLIPNSKGADLKLYIKLVENADSVPDQATDQLCKATKKAGINVVMGINKRNSGTSGRACTTACCLLMIGVRSWANTAS